MNKVLKILTVLILVAGSGFLLGFAENKHDASSCRSVRITILNPGEKMLINEEETKSMLARDFGTIKGAPVESLDLDKMEKTLLDNPYISYCEIYITITNDLFIELKVRYPVIRVINNAGQNFLIDTDGVIIPVNPVHPFSLTIANGSIPDVIPFSVRNEIPVGILPDSSILRQLSDMGNFIHHDPFLHSMIEQIYILENGEIEMVPQIGHQIIVLGSSEKYERKLKKLTAFYQQEMNQERWERYTTINLKYENQVVCSK